MSIFEYLFINIFIFQYNKLIQLLQIFEISEEI